MPDRIKANGISFNISVAGKSEAPWLTFSNSHATDLSLWDEQAARFQDRFRILRYDTRGHGGTGATEGPYDFDLLAADVVALWDALGIARSHFVGLSLGGTTGIEVALRYPDRVASLVACDCRCSVTAEFSASWNPRIATVRDQGVEALADPTIQRWFTPAFRERRPPALDKVKAMIRRTSAAGYIGCAEALKEIDCEPRLFAIRCPTLFLTGDNDPSAPPDLMRTWQRLVPDSRFSVIEDAAHITNIEQPQAFNESLEIFFSEVVSGR